jgi:hypothetical protein
VSWVWAAVVLVIVRKGVRILSGDRDRAVWMCRHNGIVSGNKEREITYCLILVRCLNGKLFSPPCLQEQTFIQSQ